MRPAERAHGTLGAPRNEWETHGLPQLHYRLVESAGSPSGQEPDELLAKPVADGAGADVSLLAGPTRRDAEPVRLQRDFVGVEGEAGDGPGDVRSNPGEALELRDGPRDLPSELRDHHPCGREQVAGTGVVPRSFPCFQYVGFVGSGEGLDRRKPPDEPIEVRAGLGDPGLLQQHFRDPDPVGVAVAPPGQGAAVGPEPSEERSGQRRGVGGNGSGPGAHAHGRPPEQVSA
ncbi:MAG: hypothetical protein L3K02_00740 [Thermoplasmata archaeon]|nr:hypothetical protein [Thermoplasmata archaeon]